MAGSDRRERRCDQGGAEELDSLSSCCTSFEGVDRCKFDGELLSSFLFCWRICWHSNTEHQNWSLGRQWLFLSFRFGPQLNNPDCSQQARSEGAGKLLPSLHSLQYCVLAPVSWWAHSLVFSFVEDEPAIGEFG